MQQHTGLVHGHMHELFYHNMCYCEWHRRQSKHAGTHTSVLSTSNNKKKRSIFAYFLRKYSVVPGPVQLIGTMLE